MAFSRDQIEAMLEAEFRQEVLIPLLQAMSYKDVRLRHSAGELGKDIIGWKSDTWGNRENWALVAKAVRLSGKASYTKGSVSEVQTQIFESFGDPFDDPITAEKRDVDRVVVACNKPIGREFIEALGAILKSTNLLGRVEIWDDQHVWELYEQYIVPPIQKVLRMQADIASFDSHYNLDVNISGNTTTIGLKERFPGAAQEQPLTGTMSFAFQDSPIDKEAMEAMERFMATGEQIEVGGTHVREFNFPILRRILGADMKVDKLWMTRVPNIPPITARIEIRNTDDDAFIFPNTILRAAHGGDDEITISDEHQPGPLHVEFVLNWKAGTLQVSFFPNITFPIEAPTLYMLLWLHHCLSKPFTLKVTEPDGDSPIFNIGDQLRDPIVASPKPDDLSLAGDLAMIQLRTNHRIVIPAANFSADDIENLTLLRAVLQRGRLRTEWTELIMTDSGGEPTVREQTEQLLDGLVDGKRWFAQVKPTTLPLFGQEIPLGLARFAFCARLANEAEVRALISQDAHVNASIKLQWIPPNEPIEVDNGQMVPGNTVIVDYFDWTQDSSLRQLIEGQE
jgi:hypothetical protein